MLQEMSKLQGEKWKEKGRVEGIVGLKALGGLDGVSEGFDGLMVGSLGAELNQKLTEIWTTQARLNEALSEMFLKIPRYGGFSELAGKVDDLGTELKVKTLFYATLATFIEKLRLIVFKDSLDCDFLVIDYSRSS